MTIDTRTADLTFAPGDALAYLAQRGTTAPTEFEDLTTPTWMGLGWLDTSGYIYQLAEAFKDINAMGTLDPIRTLTTGAPKTIQAIFMEGFRPPVRALYDDVDMALLQPGPSTTIAKYVLPEIPSDNRYCFAFDTFDGDKRVRLFAPLGKITNRGNDQPQQLDNESLDMTIQLYPDFIGSVRSALQRCIDYGAVDLTEFFS